MVNSNILYGLVTVTFVNELVKRKYPEQYNNAITSLSYQLIYSYSVGQIYFGKINKIISNSIHLVCSSVYAFLKNHHIVKEPVVYSDIEFYDYGICIQKSIFDVKKIKETPEEVINDILLLEPCDYDVILFSDKTTYPINKPIYKTLPIAFDYEPSNIKFMSFSLNYNDKIFDIILSNDKYNYYIVNNTIDAFFLRYYLETVLYEAIEDEFDYQITILDDNMDLIYLDETDRIIIHKDNYSIEKVDVSLEEDTDTNGLEDDKEMNDDCLVDNDSCDSISSNDSEHSFVKLVEDVEK